MERYPRPLILAYRHSLTFMRRLPIFLGMYVLVPLITLYGLHRGFKLDDTQAAFMVPGFMVNAAASAAFISTIYGSLMRLTMQGSYQSWLAATLSVHHVLQADVLWNATRSTFAGLGIGIAGGWLMGNLSFMGLLFAMPGVILASLAASLLGMVIVSRAYGFDDVSVYEPVIAAVFVFSGVFAPVTYYPEAVQWLMTLQPIYHGIMVSRPAYNLELTWGVAFIHFSVLLAMCGVFYALAYRLLSRRLIT
ncbi:MAG: hypothetical protein COY40_03925 [Alphaproteobacteria bacterium CG_4_10_14_0_8_um_filter_53_9]|nr:MAG: hypothetical protein COY40_03925 [Alphaproteobacteria bacterium CG_4_10_14_0_8_um_filter_53_9]